MDVTYVLGINVSLVSRLSKPISTLLYERV